MSKTIKINGTEWRVTNVLSSGPGAPIHTYELTGGAYVYKIANEWKLQRPGQYAAIVTVTL